MTATFHVGDAIEVMSELPEKSVDLILTSPPFLALRSYLPADHPDKALEGGSQATPGEYIDWLVDVVEACDRVLAPHGSLVFELGDTYAGSGGAGGDYDPGAWRQGQPAFEGSSKMARVRKGDIPPYPINPDNTIPTKGSGWPLAKSLSLIPELFRLTLVYGTNPLTGRQTDRWRLRNVVRWVRPNPPVGALGDKFRPATSELMVFCKSAKRYFDLDSVRGEVSEWTKQYADRFPVSDRAASDPIERLGINPTAANGISQQGAPPLDWWNIPPGGYEGAHYAVFPPELCIKPIKAMCPERVCRQCGEPSRRIVEQTNEEYAANALVMRTAARPTDGRRAFFYDAHADDPPEVKRAQSRRENGVVKPEYGTVGWSDCGCRGHCPTHDFAGGFCVGYCPDRNDDDHWRPGLVLDPFGGSGTTALVATGHGRDCILIDLDERNYDLALQRVGPFILERAL